MNNPTDKNNTRFQGFELSLKSYLCYCVYCKRSFMGSYKTENVCRNEECQDTLDGYNLTMVYGPRS